MPRDTGHMIDPRDRAAVRVALAAALVALALAGCATASPTPGGPVGAGGPVGGDFDPVIAAPGDVTVQGTVVDAADDPPVLCLGAIAQSAPPRCSGPEIEGWTWSADDLAEEMSGTTWGSYALTGTWDGTRFAATDRIPLALYDPLPTPPDPRLDPAQPGDTPPAELERIQAELGDAPFDLLGTGAENGYLLIDVIYDDGSVQQLMDDAYGADAVIVRSAMRDA